MGWDIYYYYYTSTGEYIDLKTKHNQNHVPMVNDTIYNDMNYYNVVKRVFMPEFQRVELHCHNK